jgi:hypothetical protein
VSFTFGPDVVSRFLQKHDMDLICRAHQVVEDGYEFFSKRQLVTLFSAPNYCGEFDNAGAMMSVDESLLCSFQVCATQSKASQTTARLGELSFCFFGPRANLYSFPLFRFLSLLRRNKSMCTPYPSTVKKELALLTLIPFQVRTALNQRDDLARSPWAEHDASRRLNTADFSF